MNPVNLKLGEGLHFHDNYRGFNFPKMFIKDHDTFFVQTKYLRTSKEFTDDDKLKFWEFDEMFQSYIWKRRIT